MFIFGVGYDINKDNSWWINDFKGWGIYIVDVEIGKKVWVLIFFENGF